MNDYIMYFDEPILIQEGSIVELKERGARIIGTITENEPERTTVIVTTNSGTSYGYQRPPAYGHTNTGVYLYQALLDFMSKSLLTLEELDVITVRTLGVHLVAMNDVDFKTFTEFILPALKSNVSKRKADVWVGIHRVSKMKTFDIYNKYKLRFPYFLNKTSALERVQRGIEADKKGKVA
jgi:hypothetical protein